MPSQPPGRFHLQNPVRRRGGSVTRSVNQHHRVVSSALRAAFGGCALYAAAAAKPGSRRLSNSSLPGNLVKGFVSGYPPYGVGCGTMSQTRHRPWGHPHKRQSESISVWAVSRHRASGPQHPVVCQNPAGFFCEILLPFAIVRREKMCYNVSK